MQDLKSTIQLITAANAERRSTHQKIDQLLLLTQLLSMILVSQEKMIKITGELLSTANPLEVTSMNATATMETIVNKDAVKEMKESRLLQKDH